MKVLLLDNYDSFTYMLKDYIEQYGCECFVFRNDDPVLMQLNPSGFQALVISPGPGQPQNAGLLMQVLKIFIPDLPVLGVCLGHQAIGLHFGAKLERAKQPRHGKVDKIERERHLMFKTVSNPFLATRYHSLILSELPEELMAICRCKDEIMGLAHRDLPVFGLQFHPESCETKEGLKMIKNFLDEAKRIAQI
jgi:anthranilate synthase component 2